MTTPDPALVVLIPQRSKGHWSTDHRGAPAPIWVTNTAAFAFDKAEAAREET